MDNLTHSLIGVHLARAGWVQKYGKGTILFMFIMSNIPDLDFVVTRFFGPDLTWLFRRMWTHSIIGFPLMSLIFAYIFHFFYKHISVKTFFWLGLLATGLHVFYDLANSYGVVVLFPFFNERLELAWIFIIDLAIWAILLLPLIFNWLLKKWMPVQKYSLITLIVLGLYTGFCGVGRAISTHILNKEVEKLGGQIDLAYVFPEALGPHRFKGVIKRGDEHRIYQIPYFTGGLKLFDTMKSNESEPEVQAVRSTKRGQQLDWFFKAPVWVKQSDDLVTVSDVRFRSTTIMRESKHFSYEFRRGPDGEFHFHKPH